MDEEQKQKDEEQEAIAQIQKQIDELDKKDEVTQKRDLMLLWALLAASLVLLLFLALDAPSETEYRILQFAKEQGISVQAYPDCLFALLDENPEAEEFVLQYPFREELPVDLSNYDLSLGVPLLMQFDPRWGYDHYGSGMVGVSGGPAMCLAMAGYYVTGSENFYPDRVAALARYYDLDSGDPEDGKALITRGGSALGLMVKELAREEQKVAAYLRAGTPVIALLGPGNFGDAARFVVLTDYSGGLLSVNDPGSYVNSGKTWSFDRIRNQIRALWIIQPGDTE